MIYRYLIDKEINVRKYLEEFYLSKSKIYKLFFEKRIKVNGNNVLENFMLNVNDVLTIDIEECIDYKPVDKKLDIVYEDDYLLIINKEKGIIIHDDDKSKTNSLSNIVANYYLKNNLNINVRFAHRLDFDTTGIIIYVKDYLSFSYINHYIENHEIKRYYLCLVKGNLKNNKGIINKPISGDRHNSKKYIISKNGKEAITYYEVLKKFKDYSLVRVLLKTGRTHQIRVHMSSIGNPLLGDVLYGGDMKYINRVALHSYKLELIHPITKKTLKLEIDLPKDMKGLVK